MKRKFLLPILSVCMVVALVSVGFAAWLITGNDTSDTATGNFVTYEVSNDFFTVTVDPATDETGDIVFGKPSTTSTTNAWLTADNGVDTEKLTATFTVTVTPADEEKSVPTLLNGKNITVTLKSVAADGKTADGTFDTLAKAANASEAIQRKALIAYPTLKQGSTTATLTDGETLQTEGVKLTIPGTAFTYPSGTTKGAASLNITVTFAWGEEFGNTSTNPYTYFNADGKTAAGNSTYTKTEAAGDVAAVYYTNMEIAQEFLEEIKTLGGKKYSLTLAVADATPAP